LKKSISQKNNTEIDFARLNRWQLFPSISVAARHTERGPDLT